MTRIYLIRHAEAEGNLYRRAQGHWDGKITELGKKQIDALAERFRGVGIDAVYSSDLSRAVETAGALMRGRDLVLAVTPRLREVCMGVWEGESWGDITYRYPDQMDYFNNDPARWCVEGCETFAEVQNRMTRFILEAAAAHNGQTVVMVSHGMAIKCFLMAAMNIESADGSAELHADNTAVSLLEVDKEKIKVVFYNDNSHLTPELSTFTRQSWWRDKSSDPTSLRFEPLDPKKPGEADLYLRCYADSWRAAHGSEKGFVPKIYLVAARNHVRESPASLVKAMSGEEVAGILELDPERGARDGFGWISFLYLTPKFRGRGLGVQLIGYASAYFGNLGRRSIRLHAAVTNTHAIEFYKHFGFREAGVDPGVASDQQLMEKEL